MTINNILRASILALSLGMATPSIADHRPGHQNYNRRGHWRHGRVHQRANRYRYTPSVRYRAPQRPTRFARIVGAWEDLISAAIGHNQQVYKIGETTLSSRIDFDIIDVSDTRNCVQKIRIRVEDAPAIIDRVSVRYADGSDQELRVSGYYAVGAGDSNWRTVPGWKKCVDSIVVIGETQGRRRASATVEIWGLK